MFLIAEHQGHPSSATLSRAQCNSAVFDEPNLVAAAGLVPVVALAEAAGLAALAQQQLTVPTDKGANAGWKVASLVAGMVAGADSIEDLGLLRHGGMSRLFTRAYAPSTLGSFLRAFTSGHVRQLDAVAARFLARLAAQTPLLTGHQASHGPGVVIDVDDTIIEVHGYAKQGAGFGYSKVRGLNALLATVSTPSAAPVIVAQRLRKGSCGSPRGAKRLVADAAAQVGRLLPNSRPLVRMDSAFYGRGAVGAAIAGGCDVSVTVRHDATVKAAIAQISEDAWTPIDYPDAVFDEPSGRWISAPRSPRSVSPPSPRRNGASRCPAGWSCAGSPSSTQPGKTGCSTCGGSTHSSPPAASTRWPRTRPTVVTPSSNTSTPT
jgi:hypothetical protein